MDIEKLDHSNIRTKWDMPRCERRKAVSSYTNKHSRFDLTRCKHNAQYNVDGELLCERHAGIKLIDYHLSLHREKE